MKRLLTTTAIVAMTAMPLAAQEDSGSDQSEVQLGAEQMRMSSLMDMSVYMTENGEAPNWDEVEGESVPDSWIEVGTITDVFLNQDGTIAQVILEPSSDVESDAQQVAIDMGSLEFHTSGDGEEAMTMVAYTGDELSPADSEEGGEDMASGEGSGDMAATEGEGEDMAAAEGDGEMVTTGTGEGEDMASDSSGDMSATEGEDGEMASAEGEGNMSATEGEGEEMASGEGSGDMAATEGEGEEMASTEMNQDARDALTAEDLEGQPVYGTDGDRIGEIGQLVLNDEGKIDQVIFDVGGFLGLGEKPVAVSYDDVKIMEDPENSDLRVETDYTEDELKSMERWED